MSAKPLLSVLVIAYRMPEQVLNTAYTLSHHYQRGVDPSQYEVIVVENASDRPVPVGAIEAIGPNFRHIVRQESGVSPAPALNEAFAASTGACVGIMVDGARMVTPGVIRNVLDVFRMDPDGLVAVGGFHLGEKDQQEHHVAGYDAETERLLLDGLPRQGDGYRLFELSCLSLANPFGWLHPMMESNCMFVRRESFDRIGRADERFDLPGGGMVNLDIYRELAELPETTLWVLPGEGSFHQFHGGVTTQFDAAREDLMARFREQYTAIRGKPFHAPPREPQFYGEVPLTAMPWLRYSAVKGIQRFVNRNRLGLPVWSDDMYPMPHESLLEEFAAEQGFARPAVSEGPYLPQSVTGFLPRHVTLSPWFDHMAFAYDLVGALRPETVVELGTHSGLSYFTFCQAMAEHGVEGRCFAVDTWQGERHSGEYDDAVFRDVDRHNQQHYSGFSTLMRMLFADAVDHFPADSIDLLHIDGLHTYEAVSQDFEAWYPKVRPGGIILFHDVMSRITDYGVWRFWEELQPRFATFTFHQAYGLGVLRKPGGARPDEELLRLLFGGVPEDLRSFYAFAARDLVLRLRADVASKAGATA